ncbi:RNA polymerase sigma factor (sigma-70 family) [Melghiribacillus thermohalophilus]|uniref:RNA polymerase sigma factor (Sigma-70 family) n=1 Tax=Melghiribacillus thermohalophilus TaxID=1324956 RepID=A0A4V2V135_9BACI|nr:RNA polymerase sigma factor [Melghiribacillus thermohalophilus]TCT19652.1 RNA polymerase sigma factor (sigma-70 family) [Melghiribacillus thermohalophilus]
MKPCEGRGRAIHDEVLIKKIKSGNQQALRLLIEKYKQHIFKITYSVVKDLQEAEDLTQEVFLKMMDALPSYESRGFKSWLSRIAFNTAIDAYRKKKRKHEELTAFEEDAFHPIQEESAEWAVIDTERKRNIEQAIGEMPESYRTIVKAHYLEGKSYQEIGEEFHLAKKTVEMRLYRARKWMREHWKEDDF